MIVREDDQHVICIEQDHHAHIAAQMIEKWKSHFLNKDSFAESVLYAIEQHDVGWHYFDKEPLWNDETKQPYTFIDLPLLIKTVLYTYGVTIVEKRNPYAAALCSAHYTKFLEKYEMKEVQQYITKESLRREKIIQAYPEVCKDTFAKHLALLQLADNMSLYICLHEAGENLLKHRYFKNGIYIPEIIDKNDDKFISAHWTDDHTLQLGNIEHVESFSICLEERFVPKKRIKQEGFLTSYEKTSPTTKNI